MRKISCFSISVKKSVGDSIGQNGRADSLFGFTDGSFFQPDLFDYPTRRDFGVPLEEIEGVMGREIQPAQRSPSEFKRRHLDIEFGDVVFVDGEK